MSTIRSLFHPAAFLFCRSCAVLYSDTGKSGNQVVSVIRSDVPDSAPMVGEVPFFLGINYLKAMKASLDGDVQLQVLSKQSLAELIRDFPEDVNTISTNLWTLFGGEKVVGTGSKEHKRNDDLTLDKEKQLTKKRILEATNFRKEQQFAQLCKAARTGDMEQITLLARQGANLDMQDYDGRTAVHMAVSSGRYKIVESLLKLGASSSIKDRWGQTPMAIAIKSKQQMVITVLATAKAKLDIEFPELELCTAAGSGDSSQVKRLIDFGVPPNSGDYDLRTALHVAAAEGHEKIVVCQKSSFTVNTGGLKVGKEAWLKSPILPQRDLLIQNWCAARSFFSWRRLIPTARCFCLERSDCLE